MFQILVIKAYAKVPTLVIMLCLYRYKAGLFINYRSGFLLLYLFYE